jgi:hypothetical protein
MSAEAVIDRLLTIHREERRRSQQNMPGKVEGPLGSNNVKFNTWYYGRPVHGGDYMWCAAYQSWVNAMGGVPMNIYPKAAGVVFVRDFFKQRGRIFQTPKVGDYVIFIFSPTAHHIGFVETLESDGQHFTSIEGNVSSRIMRVRHSRGDRGIVGYARPEYDKVEEDDMTKQELIDVLRSGFTPGFDTVTEWASQLNTVKREVEEIKRMLEEMQH